MSLLLIIYGLTLESYKIEKIPLLILCLIAGIIISLMSFQDSVEIIPTSTFYVYIFHNPFLLIFIVFFDFLILFFIIHVHIRSRANIPDQKIEKYLFLSLFLLGFIIFTYTYYTITQTFLFADISNLFYILSSVMNLYVIVKNPHAFIAISNEINEFIIFHKSGILLFSYNFKTGQETDETLLKGSILIGINHILSKFLDKKDQLNLIKLENHDLVFQYDIDYGYAVLLITNQKNHIITKAVKNLMEKFNETNKETLRELEKASLLIDISAFKNTKELINEYFKPYIQKKNIKR
ncbi:MAG: hypothetical protein ACFFBP_08150 [Promethearchaeota archaeon]